MSVVTFPLLNSENFYEVDAVLPTGYHTKHFLTDWWQNTLYEWQRYNKFYDLNKPEYFVKKELTDTVTIQVNFPTSGAGTIQLRMMNCDGEFFSVSPSLYLTQITIAGNTYDANGTITPIPLKTYQYKFKISDIIGSDEGYYYFVITQTIGSDVNNFISEPTWIADSHPDTILIQYANSVNDFDTVFNSGASFSVRVDACLLPSTRNLNIKGFRNQKTNYRQVSAKSYKTYRLIVGCSEGVNSVFYDKIVNIQMCDTVYYDGKRMLLAEDSEPEFNPFEQLYPLGALNIELEEYFNSQSVVVDKNNLIPIYEYGEYPYIIIGLYMLKDFVSYSVVDSTIPADYVEVFDSTVEDAEIATFNTFLTANGFIGSLIKSGGTLYYEKGLGENVALGSLSRIATGLRVSYTTVTAQRTVNTNILQLGFSIASVWTAAGVRKVIPTAIIGNSTDFFTVTTDEPHYLYLYSDDTATRVDIVSDITYKTITALTGKMSANMQEHRLYGANIPTFTLDYLFHSAFELAVINIQYASITSIDTTGFDVDVANKWRYFNFIYLLNNALTSTALDDILNDYQTYILYTYYGLYPVGVINLSLQAGGVVRTSASDLAVTNLTATGYTILP